MEATDYNQNARLTPGSRSFRYSVRHWREKEIDSEAQRRHGLCPLTPEEAGLFLKALGFNESTLVYIAAGDIYGGHERMAKLAAMFPNLVSHVSATSETLF